MSAPVTAVPVLRVATVGDDVQSAGTDGFMVLNPTAARLQNFASTLCPVGPGGRLYACFLALENAPAGSVVTIAPHRLQVDVWKADGSKGASFYNTQPIVVTTDNDWQHTAPVKNLAPVPPGYTTVSPTGVNDPDFSVDTSNATVDQIKSAAGGSFLSATFITATLALP